MNAGDKIGTLTLIEISHREKYAGRMTNFWLCQCQCGRTQIIPQSQIKRKLQCSVCLRGPCVICGSAILDDRPNSNTCCEEHALAHRRKKDLLFYTKRITQNPDFNKTAWQKKKARAKSDPLYAEKVKMENKKSYLRKKAEPDYHQKQRNYYAEKKEYILQRRKERFESLSESEKNARKERMRELNARWYRDNKTYIQERNIKRWENLSEEQKSELKRRLRTYARQSRARWLERLRKDPAAYREYLDGFKKYDRERTRRNALNRLLRDSQNLIGKNNESDNQN